MARKQKSWHCRLTSYLHGLRLMWHALWRTKALLFIFGALRTMEPCMILLLQRLYTSPWVHWHVHSNTDHGHVRPAMRESHHRLYLQMDFDVLKYSTPWLEPPSAFLNRPNLPGVRAQFQPKLPATHRSASARGPSPWIDQWPFGSLATIY